MKKIIDISPEISPEIAVWPGDVQFSRAVHFDTKNDDNLTLSSVTSTVHIGAHADAANHYHKEGVGISETPLGAYFGECQVLDVKTAKGHRIQPEDVVGEVTAPRVLLRTGSFPDPNHFNEDFCSLSPELIEWLEKKGVVLVGIDTPSVDPFSSKALESHQALYQANMANLEGLVLSHVEVGEYVLSALPLKIKGADASPVRAVLIQDV